jgi:hypothetical protein
MMNRRNLLAATFVFACTAAHAAYQGTVRVNTAPGVRVIPGLGTNLINNPALKGGILNSGLPVLTPGLSAVPSLNIVPGLNPAANVLEGVKAELGASAQLPGVLGALERVTASLSETGDTGGDKSADISGKTFDNAGSNNGGGDVSGGNGGGNNGGGNGPIDNGGVPNNPARPQVIFLLDVFQGPISDNLARYLDILVDQKVQIVIITDRPESGPGSISEVALSKLKAKRANGVIVVANNGGKIFSYSNKRSKSHAPLVANVPGFPEQALQSFDALNNELAAKYGVSAPAVTRHEDGKGKNVQVLSYSIALPSALSEKSSPKSNRLKADLWLASMNTSLKKAGVPYTFELLQDASGALTAVTHATPLRGSLGRIREALKLSMNGQDVLAERPEDALIVADPAWWKNFQRQPEIKDVSFLGAKTAADAERQLGAMLGDLKLQKTYVDRYMVESYVRWKHYQSYKTEGEELDAPAMGGGFGGGSRASKDGREMGSMYLWRAAVVSKVLELMGKELRDGSWTQLKEQTLDNHVRTLYKGKALQVGSQVYMPFQNADVANSRGNALWAKYGNTHLDYIQRFVRNLRKALVPGFPMDVREFAETIHRLGSEATSRTTLLFRNLLTGRMYTVGTRVPLSRLDVTPEGQTFIAHVPRTGKRVPEVDDFTAKMMALALLKADGVIQKADGTWEVNHLPLTQIKIEFHYYRVVIPYVFTPKDLMGEERVVTNSIEKMLADEKFIKHYEETMGERDKAKAEAKKAKADKTGAKPAPEKKKPAKPAVRRRNR